MVWQGKALGALIGVVAAGPVGALFGTFIGHLFDVQAESARDELSDSAPPASPQQVQEAFFRATFQAMGHRQGRWPRLGG
jgi:DnaJ like chaperone protein